MTRLEIEEKEKLGQIFVHILGRPLLETCLDDIQFGRRQGPVEKRHLGAFEPSQYKRLANDSILFFRTPTYTVLPMGPILLLMHHEDIYISNMVIEDEANAHRTTNSRYSVRIE